MSRSTTITISPTPDNSGEYPTGAWSAQQTLYSEYWYHFDGTWLDATIAADSSNERYPLHLNPFNMACLLHAGFLFGEVTDSSDPLVTPAVEPWGQNSAAAQRDMAQRCNDLLLRVWAENHGRAIQQEAGIVSQVLGGCVFGTAFDPTRTNKGFLPLRIDHTMPEYFFPVWGPSNYTELLEAIIAFQLSKLQAKHYGVEVSSNYEPYMEHWKPDTYKITVGSHVANWAGTQLAGRTLAGVVPYTYIPHIRAGEFYGISLLDGKLSLAKEINRLYADMGDIVGENARSMPAIGNTRRPTIRRLAGGVTVLDLGNETPGMGTPWVKHPSAVQTNESTVKWASELLNHARTEAYTPPVCYGLDEGSQRSALTLAFRMIPLIVHIRQERTNWSGGLNQVNRQLLLLASAKGVENAPTLEEIQRVRIWQDWAPVLPRDREQDLNEVILRFNAHLISPEQAIKRFGDVRDVKTEMNLIKEWMETESSLNMPALGNPFGGSSTDGQLGGTSKPQTPQAQTRSKEE